MSKKKYRQTDTFWLWILFDLVIDLCIRDVSLVSTHHRRALSDTRVGPQIREFLFDTAL